MSYSIIKLSQPLLLCLLSLAIAVATDVAAIGNTPLTSTTRMGDIILPVQQIQNHYQDANDVVLLTSSSTRSTNIRSTKKTSQLVQHNNRNLQQTNSLTSCNTCTGNLYEVSCSAGREKDDDMNGKYMFQNSINATCYVQVCCSINDGEDCCIDSKPNSIESTNSYYPTSSPKSDYYYPTSSPKSDYYYPTSYPKSDYYYPTLSPNSIIKGPTSSNDRSRTCPTNLTVWDVKYCKYGQNPSQFGTYSGSGEFAQRYNASGTCCAKTIDECCLPSSEIDVIIYNTSPAMISNDEKLSAGTIVGIVVGIICIIVLTSALVVIYTYQRRAKQGNGSTSHETSSDMNKTTGHSHPPTAINGDSRCDSNMLNQSMNSFQSSSLQSGVPAQPQQQKQQQQQQPQQQQQQQQQWHQHQQYQHQQQQQQQQQKQFDLNVTIPTSGMDDMSAITYEPFSTYQSHFPIVTDCEPCVDGSAIHNDNHNNNQTNVPQPFVPPSAKC